MDIPLKSSSIRDTIAKLALRVEVVENFISHQFGKTALRQLNFSRTEVINDSTKLLVSQTQVKYPRSSTKQNKENNVIKRKLSSVDVDSKHTRKRTRCSRRINYKEDDSDFESDRDSSDYNTLLVPKIEEEDPSYNLQISEQEVISNDDENNEYCGHSSDLDSAAGDNPRRSTSQIETRRFMQKLKKVVETNDTPISEIVSNALNGTTEEIRSSLPKIETIKNILRKIRKTKLGTPSKPRTLAPHIDQLIQKLKQEENSPTKNKLRKTLEFKKSKCTNPPSFKRALKQKVEVTDDENDNIPLLIPKIEMDTFGGDINDADDDDQEIPDINKMAGEEEIEKGDCKDKSTATDYDEIEAPWLKEDYVSPVIFRSACGRVLVFQEYTYCQERKPKHGGLHEIGKKSWKCSTGRVRGRDQCKARMYTWGPEYKVLGIVGEHNHPPRTQKLEKEVFMKKLKELVQTTNIPINEIISNALKEASDEMKANLPKVESIQKVLRKCRASDPRPASIMTSHKTKIDFLIKQLSENNESTNKNNDTKLDTDILKENTIDSENGPACKDSSMKNTQTSDSANSSEDFTVEMIDDEIEAPWMKEDYVPPVLFQSACGHVLVFKEYTYCQERKPKAGESQENVKQSWRCSVCGTRGRDKCWARMYTWGTEYKVLAIVGEHNHPPRTQKIEKEIFMKNLKECIRTSEIPISEAINNSLKDASEEMKANLPKIESIQKTLRRVRDSKSRSKCNVSNNKSKIDHLAKHLSRNNSVTKNSSNTENSS